MISGKEVSMLVIIDYGLGNIGSMANMLKKAGAKPVVSSDAGVIGEADRLILPGVGAFDSGMRNLHDRGLVPVLNRKVIEEKTPVMGVCLGMQLLGTRSGEGTEPGLGWIDAESIRFRFDGGDKGLRIPHMGWNELIPSRSHPIFAGLEQENRFYFVHSFHVVCSDGADVLARTEYGYPFTSAVKRGNILGVQFHPEKSHRFGLQLMKNFIEWDGA
jgi:imidazole glycerol-phosphate synthase subunit HisH